MIFMETGNVPCLKTGYGMKYKTGIKAMIF